MWTMRSPYTSVNTLHDVNPAVYSFADSGTYTVNLQTYYRACPTVTLSTNVRVYKNPEVDLGQDTAICPGSNGILLVDKINEGRPGASWMWNTGQTSPSITIGSAGMYFVKTSIYGCVTTDTIWVKEDCYMNVPNVFTPNGDGVNDYFYPRQYLTKGLTTFTMNIYNRWGQEIFTTNTLDGRGWDGKFNDAPQPEGVYIYTIDATFKDGQKEHKQGNITLMR